MKEQGYMLNPFDFCNGCSYLSERLQAGVSSDMDLKRPFCRYYQLHFSSVRQIDNIINRCMHFDKGNI